MTPHGKANHNAHTQQPPSVFVLVANRTTAAKKPEVEKCHSLYFQPRVECAAQGLAAVAPQIYGLVQRVAQAAYTAPYCASAHPSRLTVLRSVGGVSWANQARGGACRRERTSEQLFSHQFQEKKSPVSVGLYGRFGLTPPEPISPSARAARSARLNSTSQGTGSLPMRRSWSFSTNCGRASGRDQSCGGVESGHASALRRLPAKYQVGPARDFPIKPRAGVAPGPQDFSSGDGLGNHQPGSNTWGGRNTRPAPSGRARDRAICPAVARFKSALVPAMAADTTTAPDISDPSVAVVVSHSNDRRAA